jgi:hypothetical protein
MAGMSANLHDHDFYAWTQQQLGLMRLGELSKVDLANLIDEVESMGASERRELYSRFFVLVHHLLKWEFQPEERSNSWKSTIVEQRDQLEILLGQSPSLRRFCSDALADAYPRSRRKASAETGLPLQAFPDGCPYTVQQVLSLDFYPGLAVG